MKEINSITEKLSQYSRLAAYQESSHTINNLLTSAKIHVTMSKRYLEKGNQEATIERLGKIDQSLDNLVRFSNEISGHISIPTESSKNDIQKLIQDSVEIATSLFKGFEFSVDFDFDEFGKDIDIDPSLIEVLIISFLATGKRMYNSCDYIFNTKWNDDRTQLKITGITTNIGELNPISEDSLLARSSGSDIGEIPLSTMKRIIQTQFKHVNLQIPEIDKHEFILVLNLSPLQ